jgi:hypothetical protein
MWSSLDRIEIGRQSIQRPLQTTEVVASVTAVTHYKTHTRKSRPKAA